MNFIAHLLHSVPQKDNRIWDYLYSADMTLNHVKRTEKNNIILMNGKPASEDDRDMNMLSYMV